MILVLVSLTLVAGGVGLFAWTVKARSLEHCERLALLPIDDSEAPRVQTSKER